VPSDPCALVVGTRTASWRGTRSVPSHPEPRREVPVTHPDDIDHIDHSVLMTRDLERTAAVYEALGFTLSPLSRHHGSATPGGPREPMGAGNRCAYFGRSYLELLGVFFDGSRDPWNVRPLVEAHAGLRGVVLGAGDCDVARARLDGAGVPVSPVLGLQREVDTPGGVATARFRTVNVAREATPEGEVLVGQQLTPELVYQPRFLTHPNGATGLAAMLLVVADDELDAHLDRWGRLLGRTAESHGAVHTLRLDDGRIDIAPLTALDALLPGETAPLLPFLAAQTVGVADLDVARRLVTAAGFTVHDLDDEDFFVPAAQAAGAALAFTGTRS
jgi:Glyoxalase-like domain